MLLCITIISLFMVVTVTAQSVRVFNTNGSHIVGTRIDEKYNNVPTTFITAPGFSASSFRISHFRKGYYGGGIKPCDTMEFDIQGPGGLVYYHRNHKDKRTNVTGGPLAALVLLPGTNS